MASTFPGGLNTMIPLFDQSGHLQISYGRNPKSYALNKYTAQQVCPGPRGAYLTFDPLDAHRLNQDHKWAFGTQRPSNPGNLQGFRQSNFVCERYNFDATLDNLAIDLASFDVTKVHTEKLARQAMLSRTKQCLTKVLTTTNYSSAWQSSNVKSCATLLNVAAASSYLSGGTTADPRIQTVLQEAALIVQAGTGGIGPDSGISVLMNHKTAIKLGRTREIREYLSNQVNSVDMITGEGKMFAKYGLSSNLYGFNVVIEDAYINSSNKDVSGEALSVIDTTLDNALYLFVREGDLMKSYMDAGFSSWTTFVYNDFETVAQVDDFHKLTRLAVTDFVDFQITAEPTVVKITNIFS